MNPTIIAALITGIASPILTWMLKRLYDDRVFERIVGRRKALLGTWKGTIHQEIGRNGPMKFTIRITFSAVRKRVRGHAVYEIPGQSDRRLDFIGGFIADHLLKLDYTNPDNTKTQFGCYVAELDAEGTGLAGYYAGYGSIAGSVVYGSAKLVKMV